MARPVLPEGSAAEKGAGSRRLGVPTVEINGTFYACSGRIFAQWAGNARRLRLRGQGTALSHAHEALNKPVAPLGNFLASGVLSLGAKLGPILWQFPPNFRFNPDKLDNFFNLLPRDTEQAAAIGRRHDSALKGRPGCAPARIDRLRHAMEIRHESFRDPAFIELLRRHDIALVCADTVEWPLLMDLTVGLRLLPPARLRELYRSGYGRPAGALGSAHPRLARRQGDERWFTSSTRRPRPAARRLRLLRQHRQAQALGPRR